jgi:hypothetical protein
MMPLPPEIITLLIPFAPLFSRTVFQHAQVLVGGAILTPGQRTVTSALRAMGLSHSDQFQNYHRVLNRAHWSPLQASQVLLRLLVKAFAPQGPLVIGGDDTLERRRGVQIKAKGIYRDAARSSHKHLVKTSGLRWLCLMLLVPIPFAQRLWALPFLTMLAPSQRYQKERAPKRKHHKTLVDWMRQSLLQVRRWFPERDLVLVADSSFAVLELLASLQQRQAPHQPITVVTRLRLDAGLYEPAPPPPAGKKSPNGRPPLKGKRLPTLQQRLTEPETPWTPIPVPQWYGGGAPHPTQPHKGSIDSTGEPRMIEIATGTAIWYHTGKPPVPVRWVLLRDPQEQFRPQALLCTDMTVEAGQVVQWYVSRWQVEVTFHEVREHLGVETQRQWSAPAIARTTPVLLGLFSLVTLLAQRLVDRQAPAVRIWGVRQSAWYVKDHATFTDALAWVRRHTWSHAQGSFYTSHFKSDREKLQYAVIERMTDLLCYAA